MSCKYLGILHNKGFSKESTKPDKPSVRVPIPDTMGLPGGVIPKSIVKRRMSSVVRASRGVGKEEAIRVGSLWILGKV